MELNWSEVDPVIEAALREDAGRGDLTTDLLFDTKEHGRASFIAKQDGVIAGLPVAERVFRKLEHGVVFTAAVEDGTSVPAGSTIAEVGGSRRALLTGERLALNFLQRMSGIATLTSRYVAAVKGLKVKILDTRKTAPGLRLLDKYAVRMGGAWNHRPSLADLVMIKDNHIRLTGGISEAIRRIRARQVDKLRIEVETSNLDEVREALEAGADIIMLDNMSIETMRQAVKLASGKVVLEASGSISLENVRAVAETGVNVISIGRLTHSAPALDISMKAKT